MLRPFILAALVAFTSLAPAQSARSTRTLPPDQFFGFPIGADGELARYPKILEYLQHLSKTTDRVKYQEIGKTTMGNPYVLATISAPANLAKLDRLIEINRRLADPRGLSAADARQLAQEGRAFYFIYGSIHSTEVGNTQALIEVAHRLATGSSPDVRQILDNVVVLLVPSQNPDGQVPRPRPLVQDEGHAVQSRLSGPLSQVRRSRRQPRLVHVHAEGDPARAGDPEQVQADHHARHAPDGLGRCAHLRAAVRRPARPERPPDHRAGHHDGRAGDGLGARGRGQGGRRVPVAIRSLDARPAVHGLPRPAAHPDRDCERESRRSPGQRERRADGTAGRPLELPAPVQEERVAAAGHRGLRRYRRLCRDVPRREVPDGVARELLPDSRRLGEPHGRAVCVRRAGRPARSVRDPRDARHPAAR